MKESSKEKDIEQEKKEEEKPEANESEPAERVELKSSLKTVLTNKYYICMCSALTGVFYLCTGI